MNISLGKEELKSKTGKQVIVIRFNYGKNKKFYNLE